MQLMHTTHRTDTKSLTSQPPASSTGKANQGGPPSLQSPRLARTPLPPPMDHPVYEEVLQAAAAAEAAGNGGGWTLNLNSRRIREAGAAAVAAALGGGACGGLKTLGLWGNRIGEGGAAALEAALKSGACGGLTKLDLSYNQIGPEAQQAVDDALADVPQSVRRRAARTVAALQRLAFARVAVGAGSARWSSGGGGRIIEEAVSALPFIASRTVGAPDRSLLLEVGCVLATLPESVAPAAVVARHAAERERADAAMPAAGALAARTVAAEEELEEVRRAIATAQLR